MKKKMFLGYYNYTVILTYIGMLSGFLGIVFAIAGHPYMACLFLMGAGFCDMFDGCIASTKKDRTPQEKHFGIQIDSLSDIICFCVLPAVLTYTLNIGGIFAAVVVSLFTLCGLIRLAYFNVDEFDRQQGCSTKRERYYGMPVTMSAILIPTIYCFCRLMAWDASLILLIALCIMGVCNLLAVPVKKPHLFGKICFLLFGVFELVLVILAGGKSI